jgi:hypothetical protein
MGTADRLLTVRANVTTTTPSKEQCFVRLIDRQGKVLQQDQFAKGGQAGFVNTPGSGQFFVDIACGSGRTKRYGPYLFEKDHTIDLGEATLL